MTSVLPRTFGVLGLLVGKEDGLTLGEVAAELEIPKSAAHRTLATLVESGFVVQSGMHGRYRLGMRFISQALKQLERVPAVVVSGPVLDRLAAVTGELVRLGLPDGDDIVWVAKRQGSMRGLRFDSDSGSTANLARTSTGLVWLSTMDPVRARSLVAERGFDDLHRFGPEGPSDVDEVMSAVGEVRATGFSFTESTYELGLASLAVPVARSGEDALAVLVVTGPSVRVTRERAMMWLPALQEGASELLAAAEEW